MFHTSFSNKNVVSWIRNECYQMNGLLNIFVCKYGVKREIFTEQT